MEISYTPLIVEEDTNIRRKLFLTRGLTALWSNRGSNASESLASHPQHQDVENLRPPQDQDQDQDHKCQRNSCWTRQPRPG